MALFDAADFIDLGKRCIDPVDLDIADHGKRRHERNDQQEAGSKFVAETLAGNREAGVAAQSGHTAQYLNIPNQLPETANPRQARVCC
ncbi:hypothetical protein [Stenotrophomonas koreensis]|uniref:hypothetical protein n=1 Tax=Stenotrophomonas koreensis TaxID=266128 RepID=UPI002176177E|nr:hypothetical protein [Stenotrophomonas koreensis]